MRRYLVIIGLVLLILAPFEMLAFFHPPDGQTRADWLQFVGRFHMIVIHVPICLVALVPILELAGRRQRWSYLRPAAGLVLGLAALSAIVAVIFGGILAYGGGYAGKLVEAHMWGGVALSLVCGAALGLRAWTQRQPSRPAMGGYITTLLIGVGLMAWTGHQGGSLTHGDGYLTQRMPGPLKTVLGVKEPQTKALPGQPADAFYLTHIQPIFDEHCVLCHGEQKKKGGLRLDTYAELGKGGEKGIVVAGADMTKSELFRRITLPGDHKEFMPSDGKKPLTAEEVLLIKQWIIAGASPSKSLADLRAEGIEVAAPAARVAAVPPAAPDYRPFVAQLAALEAKLHVQLVPVSQTATDGLVLRTVSDPQSVNDAVLAQLTPIAPLIVDAELSRTRVTDQGLPAIAKMTNLRQLDLGHTAIRSARLAALMPLTHLHTLNFVGTGVDDTATATLRRLHSLKEVYNYGSKMSVSAESALATPVGRPAHTAN